MAREFTTSGGVTISAAAMDRIERRVVRGDDWQRIATDELRSVIPSSDDDLSEVNEVLAECESRIEQMADSHASRLEREGDEISERCERERDERYAAGN